MAVNSKEMQKWDKKTQELYARAKEGDSSAQFCMGVRYRKGLGGVTPEMNTACEWFKKAADQNHRDAQYNLGVAARYRETDEIAIQWFLKAAEQGHYWAQYNLGVMYKAGEGTPINYRESQKWFSEAAKFGDHIADYESMRLTRSIEREDREQKAKEEQARLQALKLKEEKEKAEKLSRLIEEAKSGKPEAQYQLAVKYFMGQDLAKDEKQAFELFEQSAGQGNASAQQYLGYLYSAGIGTVKNVKKSFEYYLKAAKQGNADAQYWTGTWYYYGNGIKKSDKQAVEWLSKAELQGNTKAQGLLGSIYWYGTNEIAQDCPKALEYWKKGAEKENMDSQNGLGTAYFHGKGGVTKDLKQAIHWIKKAAEQGLVLAQKNLASIYRSEEHAPKDLKLAVEWYKKAAESGDQEAQNIVGHMYLNGTDGVLQSPFVAKDYLQKAADQGNDQAQAFLGIILWKHYYDYKGAVKYWRMCIEQGKETASIAYNGLGASYLEGKGVDADYKEAMKWLLMAAKEGHYSAYRNLGLMFEEGKGVPEDLITAYRCYTRAVELGDNDCIEKVKEVKEKFAKSHSDIGIVSSMLKEIERTQQQKQAPIDNESFLKSLSPNLPIPIPVQQNKEVKVIKEQIIVDNASQLIPYSEITLGDLLGKGGYGEVFKATWRHATVAVKKFLLDKPSDDIVKDFVSEFQTMSKLKSPNIVQFYGYCAGPYCIVMEYMPQGSLYHVLHDKKKKLEQETILKIAKDMSYGLAFLHKAKIVHRDIKSLNILLGEGNTAKFTDFGLATVKNGTATTTKNKGIAGTYAWMAPELALGDEGCTTASDVYSFGVTLWELSSRDIPFKKVAKPELIPLRASQGLRDEIPKECPKKLATLITACWEGDPKKRPSADSIAEFWKSKQEDFRQFLPQYMSSKIQSGELLDNLHSEQVEAADANAANSQGLSGLMGNLASYIF